MNEAAGKITGNEQLKLKGKLQVAKVDLKKKMDVKDRVNEVKEDIAKKVNDKLDQKGKK